MRHRKMLSVPSACLLMPARGSAPVPLGGPESVVETACPLDCPDACSLSVTVQHGKIVEIDGSHSNPVTDGFICAKVRKFGDRVYGPDRLLYPAVRKGRKGEGRFERVSWDEALELIAERMRRAKAASGGASILPYSYGGSNGLLTQDNLDATLWRRLRHVAPGAHALRGADGRRQHGALRQDAVGHLPGLSRGRADHPLGRQSVGLRAFISCRTSARRRSAAPSSSSSTRARRRWRGRPTCTWPSGPGTDVAVALAIHRYLFEHGFADEAFLARAHARRGPAARTCGASGRSRGRRRSPASTRRCSSAWRSSTRRASPALIRCGWGLERNRNGGNAAMAVLALPAVGGKFGVRGGGYSMSNSASWDIERPWIDARGADDAPRQHEPSGPGADRVSTIRRSTSCSSTTATRW